MHFSKLISDLTNSKADLLNHQIAKDPEINSGASIDCAKSDQISFLEYGSPLIKELQNSFAGAIFLPPQEELINHAAQKGISYAVFKDPRLAFAESLGILKPRIYPKEGIHASAVIEEGVVFQGEVSIGPNCYIGKNCHIGRKTIIHPGVVIYDEVLIGEGCELHSNCVIHPESSLGNGCVIHSNAVIGSEGFGFVSTANGWEKMPQTGKVILEDNVEIGCNSCVDRPAVGETLIGRGTKIDNLVQIGHGVKTGYGCAMASQVGIAGGAKIGNGVILAGQVGVGNRVKVGDRVIASSKCGIHADVESNQTISGFPAIPNRLWLRCSANFKKLPELAKTIKDLTRQPN